MSRGGRPPPGLENMYSLKVDNLTYRTSPETLKRAFEKYGDVGDVYIPRDKYSKESRGFAFVRFYDQRDAEDAMDSMDGKNLDGRELRVAMARYGRPTESGHGRDYGRRSYGGPPRRPWGRSYGRRRSYSRSRSRSRSRRRRRSRSRSSSRSRSRSAEKDRKRRHSSSRSRSRSRSSQSSKSHSRSKSPAVNGD